MRNIDINFFEDRYPSYDELQLRDKTVRLRQDLKSSDPSIVSWQSSNFTELRERTEGKVQKVDGKGIYVSFPMRESVYIGERKEQPLYGSSLMTVIIERKSFNRLFNLA